MLGAAALPLIFAIPPVGMMKLRRSGEGRSGFCLLFNVAHETPTDARTRDPRARSAAWFCWFGDTGTRAVCVQGVCVVEVKKTVK